MSTWKKLLGLIFVFLPAVLIWLFAAWVVSMHGGIGFFRVMGNFRQLLYILGFSLLALPFVLVAIIAARQSKRLEGTKPARVVLSGLAIALLAARG